MTDRLHPHKDFVLDCIKKKSFDELYYRFQELSLTSQEMVIFYKRHKEALKSSLFWKSKLPHFYLQQILDSDLRLKFIQAYLAKDENCNDELNKHIFIFAKYDFVRLFKLNQSFSHPNFYHSAKQLFDKDLEFTRLDKEIDIIISAQKKLDTQELKDKQTFAQFSFGEIALAFSLYYQWFKQSPAIAGNRSWQTKIEMALVQEFNQIISIFKGKADTSFHFNTNEALQECFKKNMAPHHTLETKSHNVALDENFRKLFALINHSIQRKITKTGIDVYLSGFAEFKSNYKGLQRFQTNEKHKIFRKNNEKNNLEGFYFLNTNEQFDVKSYIESTYTTLNFYGILDGLESVNIDSRKALTLIILFSIFKGLPKRLIVNEHVCVLDKSLDNFGQIFGINESLSLFEYDKLIEDVSSYFNWDLEETKHLFSAFTLDMRSNEPVVDWLTRPFIKINNQILWLGSFLIDRRWDNILINKIKKEPGLKQAAQLIAKNFEKRLEGIFKEKLFKAISGFRFESAKGQTGEIDLIVFKDNWLLVCEAKTGQRSDEFISAAFTETLRLEAEAAEQLEKAIFNLEGNWNQIKIALGIEESIALDSIKIFSLIVTDIFEGDQQLYKQNIPKVSLLELDVIFKNKKKVLFEKYLRLTPLTNNLNPNLKEDYYRSTKWDLWDGKTDIGIKDMLEIIKNNAIWKEIETVWKFEDEEFEISF